MLDIFEVIYDELMINTCIWHIKFTIMYCIKNAPSLLSFQ